MPASDPLFIRYRTSGDEIAFRAIVEAHVAMVHAVALRRLGPHAHLAADVAQAVFSRLARAACALPADLIVAPWLHRQAVRLAIDSVRKEERRRVRETTAAMLHTSECHDSSSAALLDEALDHLPAGDRSLLVLRYLEDRDYAAVAAALGSTPEAARKRIARSLEKLRALLGRRGAALTTTALTTYLSEQSSQAAPAAMAQRISVTALRTAGSGQTGFLITTALMSHATSITTGAIAALLACGLFYQHREKEIARGGAMSAVTRAEHAGLPRSRLAGQNTMAAPLPSTLPEIIAALQELSAAPNHRLTQERVAALLRRIAPDQYQEFFLTAEERIHPLRWQFLVLQATRLWREVDPGALTRALFESDNRKRALIRETALHRNMVFNSFDIATHRNGGSTGLQIQEPFERWLDLDFAAAGQWLRSVSKEPLMNLPWMHGGTLSGQFADVLVGHVSLGGTLESLPVEGLNASQAKLMRQRWADNVINQAGDFGKVLTSFTSNTEEARLLAYYCAQRDPSACQQAIAAMPDNEMRFAAALSFVSQEVIKEKQSVTSLDANARLPRAQFAFEQAGGRSVSESLRDIVLACLEPAVKGSEAVRAWALETGGAESSAAIAAGARRYAEQTWSMPTAMEWAGAIPDAAQRGSLLRGIYLRWSDAAPEAAAKYLTKASPELAAQLQPLPESP